MRLWFVATMACLMLGYFGFSAQAAYIIDIRQVGQDVLASGSGSLNVNLLTRLGGDQSGTSPSIDPRDAIIQVGSGTVSFYTDPLNAQPFGSDVTTATKLSTGLPVSLLGQTNFFGIILLVPAGYISGEDLGVLTATFQNATFQSLGIEPGKYVYQFGNRAGFDTFTVNAISDVPLPTSAPMFGAALIALGTVGYGFRPPSTLVARADPEALTA